MGIIVHRGGLPSPGTSLDSSAGSSDCTYARLYPDAGVKAYERPAVYHEPKSSAYDLARPVWVNEVAKYPATDHPNKPTYETTRSYAEAKCHEVAKYHHEMTGTKYHHEMVGTKYHHHHESATTKYPDLQAKPYDLPKYPEAKGYPDNLKYSAEMSNSAAVAAAAAVAKAPYACVHGQYYPYRRPWRNRRITWDPDKLRVENGRRHEIILEIFTRSNEIARCILNKIKS